MLAHKSIINGEFGLLLIRAKATLHRFIPFTVNIFQLYSRIDQQNHYVIALISIGNW